MENVELILGHVTFTNIYSEGFHLLQTAERGGGGGQGFGDNVAGRLFWEVLKDGFNFI